MQVIELKNRIISEKKKESVKQTKHGEAYSLSALANSLFSIFSRGKYKSISLESVLFEVFHLLWFAITKYILSKFLSNLKVEVNKNLLCPDEGQG